MRTPAEPTDLLDLGRRSPNIHVIIVGIFFIVNLDDFLTVIITSMLACQTFINIIDLVGVEVYFLQGIHDFFVGDNILFPFPVIFNRL